MGVIRKERTRGSSPGQQPSNWVKSGGSVKIRRRLIWGTEAGGSGVQGCPQRSDTVKSSLLWAVPSLGRGAWAIEESRLSPPEGAGQTAVSPAGSTLSPALATLGGGVLPGSQANPFFPKLVLAMAVNNSSGTANQDTVPPESSGLAPSTHPRQLPAACDSSCRGIQRPLPVPVGSHNLMLPTTHRQANKNKAG